MTIKRFIQPDTSDGVVISQSRPAEEKPHPEAGPRFAFFNPGLDPACDDLVRLAAQICEAPIAMISVWDDQSSFFRAKVGLDESVLPGRIPFCRSTLGGNDLLVVPDATRDARFSHDSLVTGGPRFRSYAGLSLVTSDGIVIGTLAAMDRVPRVWTAQQLEGLRSLSRQVMRLMEVQRELDLLRAVADETTDAVFVKDARGRYLFFNKAAVRFVGQDAPQVLGKDDTAIFNPEDARVVMEADRAVMASGETQTREENLFAAGVTRTYLATKGPFRDGSGRVVGTIGVSRDISVRKRAEEALRASEERLRIVTENARVGLVIVDREHRYTFANQAYAEILGLASSDLVGQRIADVLAPIYEEQIRPRLDRAFAGERVSYDLQKSGEEGIRHYAVSYEPTKLIGDVFLVVVVITDVTARKVAEIESERQHAELKLILDTVPALVFYKDRESRFLRVNRELARLVGVSPEAFIGQTDLEMGSPHGDRYRQDDLHVMGTGESIHGREEPLSMADGSVRWLLTHKVPRRDENGVIVGVVGFGVDITARKQAEEASVEAARFAQSTTDALSAHICVIDADGVILATNRSWNSFKSANAATGQGTRIGDNYLKVCDEATGPEKMEAAAFAEGIRSVLRGDQSEFRQEYACHSLVARNWFVGRVTRFSGNGPVRVVVAHENITERKEAEIANLRLAAIVQSSDDAIIGKDLQGVVTSWNRGAEKIFGYVSAEMIGQPMSVLIPADREGEEESILSKINRGESVENFETVRQTKTGRLINVSVTVSSIKNAEGEVLGASKVARDITERKQSERVALKMEASLRQTQARLKSTLAAGSIGTWTWDILGDRLAADEFTADVFSIDRAAAEKGLPAGAYLQAVHEDDRASVANALSRAITSHGQYDIEYRVAQRNGEFRWVQARGRVEYDGTGQATSFHGAVIDITERKRNEGRFRRLIDSNVQGVMFWNLKGEITTANNAFLQLVGYSREELEDRKLVWPALFPSGSPEGDEGEFREIATKRAGTPLGKELIRKDGSRVPVLIGAAAFEDNPDEGVCFVLDLTEQKKLEEQFRRAQRLESIGTLAGGMAHDLNNVLGPIMMALAVMEMRFTDAASRDLISVISASAQRGSDMVRQVLSFARGVEGRRLELPLKTLIRDIEKIANDTFLKHIQVRTKIQEGLWTVMGDPTQLHQVLLNLSVNARDAMPKGGTLVISAENVQIDSHYAALDDEVKPGLYVVLEVQDSGTGIPRRILDKIFEPFFTTKEIGQGTGLGLSTSIAIVKSHGGFIRVSSDLNTGTKFKVFLPAHRTSSAAAADPVAVEMPRGRGELILVVDDEASVRSITKQTLEAFGYRAIVAGDGAEAATLYANRGSEIAVVLTDMMMPVMGGVVTIQVLRRINPKVNIIVASGLAANADMAKVVDLGIKHFLAKPYAADVLLQMLHGILSKS